MWCCSCVSLCLKVVFKSWEGHSKVLEACKPVWETCFVIPIAHCYWLQMMTKVLLLRWTHIKNLLESRASVDVLLQWLAFCLRRVMETRQMRHRLSNAGRSELRKQEEGGEWMAAWGTMRRDPHMVSRRPDSLSHCRPAYATGHHSSSPFITGFQEGQSGRIGCEGWWGAWGCGAGCSC